MTLFLHRVNESQVRTVALIALSLGSFVVLLDSTVLNVALPAVGQALHGSLVNLQWTLNGYTLIFASLLMTGGTLGDLYGVRRIFCVGLCLFVFASVCCGLAPSIGLLITTRVVQGIGAALLLPTSLSLIPHLFADGQERARAVAMWGGISSLAVACGPLLGGLLVQMFGWRSVFLVNLPVGMIALGLTLLSIPAIASQEGRHLDIGGQVCAIVVCCGLTYGLIEWGHIAFVLDIVAFLVAVLAGIIFFLIEARISHPMLPLSMFHDWNVSAAMLIGLLYQFSFYGILFSFALFFQNAYHYSAFEAGIAFLPQTASGSFFLIFLTKWVMQWMRPSIAMTIGMLCGLIGMAFIFLGLHTIFLWIGCGEVLIGCSAGFIVSPMTAIVLERVPKKQAGVASASLNVARQMGGALAVALLGAVMGSHVLMEGAQEALVILATVCILGLLLALSSVRGSGKVAYVAGEA